MNADVTPGRLWKWARRAFLDGKGSDIVQQGEPLSSNELEAARWMAREILHLRAELSRLRSAPVAVEVPEPTHDQWLALAEEAHAGAFIDFMSGASAYGLWLRKNMPHAIDSSSILKDGESTTRWISVEDSLPEDGERVGFIVDCKRDDFMHGRVYGGRFNRRDWDERWGGFNTHGLGAIASHWCRLPPLPDALRSSKEGA